MSTSGRSLVGAGTVGVLSSGLLGLSLLTGSLDEPAPTAPVGGGTVVAGAIPAQYVAVVNAAGTRCEAFPAPVIAAQVQTESGWNPRAMSPAGAQGISQFMPGTWTKWGHDWTGDGVADVWFPSDAIPSQASFDCALAQRMQSALSAGLVGGATATDLALAAYNAGPGAVMAAHGIPQNGETPAYVARIEKVAASFSATAPSAPAGPFGAAVVAAARTRLGLHYVWGGRDRQRPLRLTGPRLRLLRPGPVGRPHRERRGHHAAALRRPAVPDGRPCRFRRRLDHRHVRSAARRHRRLPTPQRRRVRPHRYLPRQRRTAQRLSPGRRRRSQARVAAGRLLAARSLVRPPIWVTVSIHDQVIRYSYFRKPKTVPATIAPTTAPTTT